MIIHTCFFLFSVVQFSRTNSVAFDRRLFKYITFRPVCQVVFKKFFEFFSTFFSRPDLHVRHVPPPLCFPSAPRPRFPALPLSERLSNISLFFPLVNPFSYSFLALLHFVGCFFSVRQKRRGMIRAAPLRRISRNDQNAAADVFICRGKLVHRNFETLRHFPQRLSARFIYAQ